MMDLMDPPPAMLEFVTSDIVREPLPERRHLPGIGVFSPGQRPHLPGNPGGASTLQCVIYDLEKLNELSRRRMDDALEVAARLDRDGHLICFRIGMMLPSVCLME